MWIKMCPVDSKSPENISELADYSQSRAPSFKALLKAGVEYICDQFIVSIKSSEHATFQHAYNACLF